MKMYGYIGMEVYGLYKQNKISIPEAEIHFEKMKALEREIAELESEKQRLEAESRGTTLCSCGYELPPQAKFCPKCGKAVETDSITCSCGKAIEKDMLFCPNCGKSVKGLGIEAKNVGEGGGFKTGMPNQSNAQINDRVCICGARVPNGQRMCMECGRLLPEDL